MRWPNCFDDNHRLQFKDATKQNVQKTEWFLCVQFNGHFRAQR